MNTDSLKHELHASRDLYARASSVERAVSLQKHIVTLADQILKRTPGDPDAILAKALMMHIGPPYDSAAAQALLDSLCMSELTISQLIQAGDLQHFVDAPERAEIIFREALRRDPDCYEGMVHLPNLSRERGTSVTSDEAHELVERARRLRPDRYEAYNMSAWLMLDKDDVNGAVQELEEALCRLGADQTVMRRALNDSITRLLRTRRDANNQRYVAPTVNLTEIWRVLSNRALRFVRRKGK
ncbi:hypothetical protein BH09PLA1_BH09PLA1_08550 [soil metagenome]